MAKEEFDKTSNTIPSITSLLRRKKLPAPGDPEFERTQLTVAEEKKPPVLPEIPIGEISKIIEEKTKSFAGVPPSTPATGQQGPVHHWIDAKIDGNDHPIAQTIKILKTSGLHRAVYVQLEKPKNSGDLPKFLASGFYGDRILEPFWRGLAWNPAFSKEIWKALLETGVADFTKGAPVWIRSGLGLRSGEVGQIFRVGTTKACRGLLIVFTSEAAKKKNAEILSILSVAKSEPIGLAA